MTKESRLSKHDVMFEECRHFTSLYTKPRVAEELVTEVASVRGQEFNSHLLCYWYLLKIIVKRSENGFTSSSKATLMDGKSAT